MTRRARSTVPKENGAVPMPALPELRGSIPGVLDKTQPSRLLRHSSSTLHFAAFDPYVATGKGTAHLNTFHFEEPSGSKRVVIEYIPTMGSFWRWVPRAKKTLQGVKEGKFPRVINVCGTLYMADQDQWDIYKLDPLYDCIVHNDQHLVVHKDSPPEDTPLNAPGVNWTSAWRETSIDTTSVADSDRMDVDDESNQSNLKSKRSRLKRKTTPPPNFNFDSTTTPTAGPSNPKRFVNEAFQGLRKHDEVENEYFEEDSRNRNTKIYDAKLQKRVRTLSPNSARRAQRAKSESRTMRKQSRWNEIKEARKREREEQNLREVLNEVPQTHYYNNRAYSEMPEFRTSGYNGQSTYPDITEEDRRAPSPGHNDDEEVRIEESRRKLAALNVDRKREREREKSLVAEDEEVRKAKEESRRRQAEAQRRRDAEARRQQQAEAEEQERARLLQQKARQQQELKEKLERERIERHRQWFSGEWSASRAIERFKVVSDFFNKANFNPDTFPLTIIDIPWPTLAHPLQMTARDLDWEAITDFFRVAKILTREQEYKHLLKTTFMRFHPDRWRSKRLFNAILDENERFEVETAVETISKAIGAKYEELKE